MVAVSFSQGLIVAGDQPSAFSGYRVIFHDRRPRSFNSAPGVEFHNSVLLVDRDKRIKLALFDEPQVAGRRLDPARSRVLGQDMSKLYPVDIAPYIRNREVVFRWHRVTIAPAIRTHIILTWTSSSKTLPYGMLSPISFVLYILNETQGRMKVVFRETQGVEFRDLTVDDINQDGRMDIVLSGTTGPRGHWMRLWRVRENGSVERIPFEGEDQSPELVCPAQGGLCAIVAHHSEVTAKERFEVRLVYEWQSGKFSIADQQRCSVRNTP